MLISSGSESPPQNNTTRVFLSCYWIVTITLAATYIGNLVAFVTVTKPKLPIETVEDLAAHPEYQAGVGQDNAQYNLLKVISNKIFRLCMRRIGWMESIRFDTFKVFQ